ncbi:NAD(P)/FAD-dependent oxidoreductase [Nocardioides salsibiostraticola]
MFDVVIVGGGHNGLVAAAYLARAGLDVVVLERLGHVGGAAVSSRAFPGLDADLSRYSYLVSVMPDRLIDDLELDLRFGSRKTASYTPWTREGRSGGLLVEHEEGVPTRDSFRALTGSDEEYDAWRRFYADVGELAAVVAPTLMDPLPTERTLRGQVRPEVWADLVSNPLGQTIETRFADDTVRGVVATDALIGTFASLHDPRLIQNRCFLYHLMGNGTGEWRVPVGGMGAVTDALAKAAVDAGAELVTGVNVTSIDAGEDQAEITWHTGQETNTISCRHVLANVAPWVLEALLGHTADPEAKPEGSQLKINFLLDRLPKLKSGLDAETAFAGTLHLNEDYSSLERAHHEAARGKMPTALPGEIYCHTLTDRTILGDLGESTHTLTYFGLHTPASLFKFDPVSTRMLAVGRAIESINECLEEPIERCVTRDEHGRLCIEVKTPLDVERDLNMPGGHIFHGDLDWPWASNRAPMDRPSQQWGVDTGIGSVLLCGSGARRGGAVSGLGGHNAAMAVLADRERDKQ